MTTPTLTKTTRLQIVTSGYLDRYVVADTQYACTWRGAKMRWHSRDEAIEGVLALVKQAALPTGDELNAAIRAVRNATSGTYITYCNGVVSGSLKTTYERITAGVVALTRHAYVTADHYNEQVAIAATLTGDEWIAIASGLFECNRRNRKLASAGLRPGMAVLI